MIVSYNFNRNQAIIFVDEPWEIDLMTVPEQQFSKEERIKALIEQVSAYIEQFHRGSVELVKIDGDIVTVKLGGACAGCPLSPATLQGWVAGTLRQFFPDVQVVTEEEEE